MDYIKQLNAFMEMASGNLTPNAIAIYLRLFHINNKTGWKEWFAESDCWLGRSVGINRSETILKALNLLKQKGFIDFVRGTGTRQPTKYKILVLNNSSGNSSGDSSGHSSGTSNNPKLINNKQETKNNKQVNTERARASFTPPTLDEIQTYVLEKNLHVSAKQFYDYFTVGNWADAKGNKVKNWKQKLLTWERLADKTERPQATSQEQAFKNVMAYFESEGER
jgi:hypothetical protein